LSNHEAPTVKAAKPVAALPPTKEQERRAANRKRKAPVKRSSSRDD
jgi:hypothetical protein